MLQSKQGVYTLVLSGLMSCFFSSLLFADQYHYNDILIGNRAAGLAGSYVAVSDDPSGLYYNPSGIVYASSGNITANMNAYNIGKTTYVGALKTANGKSTDWVRTSSALVPNFFGITQPLGPGTVGFSYAITDSVLEDQGQTFNDIVQAGTQYIINFNNQDVTNNIGPSYAIAINDKLSIGLTMYGYFRTQERILNQIFHLPLEDSGFTSPSFFIINQYLSLSEFGVKPILGLTFTPFDKLSLGVSASQVIPISSTIEIQNSAAQNVCEVEDILARCTEDESTSFLLSHATNTTIRDHPWKLNMGGAYFYNNRLMITGSVWVYEAVNGTTRPLVNVAGGIEYYLTGKIAVRMGGYTNFANTPKLIPNVENTYSEHLNIVGGTMSFTFFTRTSAISIGTAGTYGRGKAQVSGKTSIQAVKYQGISLYFSASNSF